MIVIKLYVAALMGMLSLMLTVVGFQCSSPMGPRLALFSTIDVCGAPG
jgi:hypothetical protein